MLIQTRQLSKTYSGDGVETTALNAVSLSIDEGEFVAVMGPSGCGKTTLLNLLGLLDGATSGEYFLQGKDVSRLTERHRAVYRKTHIGFVFQSFNLIEELTVFENVELPLVYLGQAANERKKRVRETLERMEMMHRGDHFPQQLSGGQQQRVAIARAVISKPGLLLADEPTGNLDSGHGQEVMRLLTALNEGGTAIVMVTHNDADASYARRIIRLFDGQIISENQNQRRELSL
jgi:putative ABC transport system ATP-binding protein